MAKNNTKNQTEKSEMKPRISKFLSRISDIIMGSESCCDVLQFKDA